MEKLNFSPESKDSQKFEKHNPASAPTVLFV